MTASASCICPRTGVGTRSVCANSGAFLFSGTPSHSPAKGAFLKKRPLELLKTFLVRKGEAGQSGVFRAETLSRLKRRTLPNRLEFSLCGTLSHALPRSVFEKTPLGTPKNFFRCVTAKPDGLWAFRAGTSSRLKRPSLFRSCRREASSESPWVFDDASHHARKHKTPTEGTAHGIHRPAPKNLRLRHSGF